jgi:hypothetical protein
MLPPLVGARFQGLFTPLSRFFSPFPHGTGSLSVSREYLALPDGAGRFRQDFTGPALLRIRTTCTSLRIRDYHPLRLLFPKRFSLNVLAYVRPTTPTYKYVGLGSSAFARHYLRNHYYFLFLLLLRCFSSEGYIHYGDMSSTYRVAPFGHLRINTCLRFPVAFRSLPRPSSSSRA